MAFAVLATGCGTGPAGHVAQSVKAPAAPGPVATVTVTAAAAPGGTRTPAASAQDSPAGSPAITFSDLKESSASPFPSETSVPEPHLVGVPGAVAQRFSAAFAALMAEQRSQVDSFVSGYAESGPSCGDADGAGRAERVTLTGKTIDAAVRGTTASVSTLFQIFDGCNRPWTSARSVSVDVRTGATVPIGAITDTGSAAFQSEVTMRVQRECPGVVMETGPDGTIAKFPSYTSASDGLVLSWTNQDFSPMACGVITIRIPWDELPRPAGQAPAAGGAPVTARPAGCAGAPVLPAGIDQRVCGPVPANAVAPKAYEGGTSHTLASPSGNILCDMADDSVTCVAEEYDFEPAKEGPLPDAPEPGIWVPNLVSLDRTASVGAWMEQPIIAEIVAQGEGSSRSQHIEDVGILPYGQVAALGQVACVSQQAGMSCWNAETRHGFFLSRERYLTW